MTREGRLGSDRRHQPRRSADRRLLRDHRRAGWDHAALALRQQLAAQRPHKRLQRQHCASNISYICNAGPGYDGPTGVGSISGAAVAGAPGIGGPAIVSGDTASYTQSTRTHGATLKGGIYPNGLDTNWWIEYGTHHLLRAADPADRHRLGHLAVARDRISVAPGREHHLSLPPGRPEQHRDNLRLRLQLHDTGEPRPPTRPQLHPAPATASDSPTQFDAAARSIPAPRSPTTPGTSATARLRTPVPPPPSRTRSPIARHVQRHADGHQRRDPAQEDSIWQTVTVDDARLRRSPPRKRPAPGSPLASTAAPPHPGPAARSPTTGGTSATAPDAARSLTANHAYDSPGVYTVALTVTDDLGLTSTTTQTVIVDAAQRIVHASTTTTAPGRGGLRRKRVDVLGTITEYSWEFGDGTTNRRRRPPPTPTPTAARTPSRSPSPTTQGRRDTSQQNVTADIAAHCGVSTVAHRAPDTRRRRSSSTRAPRPERRRHDQPTTAGSSATAPADDAGARPTANHAYARPGPVQRDADGHRRPRDHQHEHRRRSRSTPCRRHRSTASTRPHRPRRSAVRRRRLDRLRGHDHRLQLGLRRRQTTTADHADR